MHCEGLFSLMMQYIQQKIHQTQKRFLKSQQTRHVFCNISETSAIDFNGTRISSSKETLYFLFSLLKTLFDERQFRNHLGNGALEHHHRQQRKFHCQKHFS